MRYVALTLLLGAAYSCGTSLDCPPAVDLTPADLAAYNSVLELVGVDFPPPSLAEQPADPSCPGSSDIRAPHSNECVGAYYLAACDCIVLPAGVEGDWRVELLRHESLHHILQGRTGDADREHEHRLWGAL